MCQLYSFPYAPEIIFFKGGKLLCNYLELQSGRLILCDFLVKAIFGVVDKFESELYAIYAICEAKN